MSIFNTLSKPIITKQITISVIVGSSEALIKTFRENFLLSYVSWASDGPGSSSAPFVNAIDTTDAASKGNCIKFFIRKGNSDYIYSVTVGDNAASFHTRALGGCGFKSQLYTSFYCKAGDGLYASPIISTFLGDKLMVLYGGWSE